VTGRELPADVHAWLRAPDVAAVVGWAPDPPIETLRCHPDLVERLAAAARPLRTARRVFVEGCPVIHHPGGLPIAVAWGTSALVVRAGGVAGPLDPGARTTGLDTDWIDVDPWPVDVLFRRGTDLLRDVVRRAYERAAEHSWH
jgi:hypothetical protein